MPPLVGLLRDLPLLLAAAALSPPTRGSPFAPILCVYSPVEEQSTTGVELLANHNHHP